MEKRFTRYSEFEAQFNINLKNYAQSKVKGGNKGDYYQFLVSLRELLQLKKVDTKKDIEELVKSKGLNTSIPGFCQVLEGIGVISKIKDKGYVFWPNRIDNRLAEFLFEYNHFKQRVLNNRNFEDDVREMFLFQFGRFEESITGVNTYQTKNRKSEDVEEDESEDTIPVTSLSFSGALQYLKEGNKIQREGWNGKGMYLKLVPNGNWGLDKEMFYEEKKKPIALLPWIGMKTADDCFVPWLASQTDLLSNDWQIVE